MVTIKCDSIGLVHLREVEGGEGRGGEGRGGEGRGQR